jgi:hypothetical protein
MKTHQGTRFPAVLATVSLTLAVVIATMTLPASAETPMPQTGKRAAAQSSDRFGDRSLENTIRTDERYGHDGLFQGPRGWCYWNYLDRPKPIQNPNLWPDMRSTYFIGRFAVPAGSSLTLRGRFPYARFFQFALYKFERNTFVAFGESLRGPEIEPDTGSSNPFRVGADRLATNRDFTLRILAEEAPTDAARRAKNTLYVGRGGEDIEGVIRIYLADQDRDGAGWGPASSSSAVRGFPSYEGTLADGTKLTAEQVVKRFAKPIVGETQKPMTTEQWVQLVQAKDNDPTLKPETAPARNPPRWEKFWTLRYSVAGVFKTPQVRAKIPYEGAMEGGGEGPYLVTYLSRQFGTVYVMRGKMPTFPDTYAGRDGKGVATRADAQTQYWSVVSCEAVPSGQVVDGLTDFQVPLDENRNYTIVVSRPQDRPNNATLENGVAWMNWSPRGEGLDDPRNRADFGMLILRIMANNPNWSQRPDVVTKPGTEEPVMGPYYPEGYYTTKAEFEAKGPKKQ